MKFPNLVTSALESAVLNRNNETVISRVDNPYVHCQLAIDGSDPVANAIDRDHNQAHLAAHNLPAPTSSGQEAFALGLLEVSKIAVETLGGQAIGHEFVQSSVETSINKRNSIIQKVEDEVRIQSERKARYNRGLPFKCTPETNPEPIDPLNPDPFVEPGAVENEDRESDEHNSIVNPDIEPRSSRGELDPVLGSFFIGSLEAVGHLENLLGEAFDWDTEITDSIISNFKSLF